MTDTAPAPTLNPAEAQDALAKAREGLDAARETVRELEARLAGHQTSAEEARKARERVAFPAQVQGNPTAKAALDQHTKAERAARDEAANVEMALAEAKKRVAAAEEAEREALRLNTLAAGQAILTEELLPLASQIDQAAAALADLLFQRESTLQRLRDAEAIDGSQLGQEGLTERRLAGLVAAAPGFAKLTHPSLERWRNTVRDHAKTMQESDNLLFAALHDNLRPGGRMANALASRAGTEAAPAEQRPAPLSYVDPVSGNRVTRHVATAAEREELAQSVEHLQGGAGSSL